FMIMRKKPDCGPALADGAPGGWVTEDGTGGAGARKPSKSSGYSSTSPDGRLRPHRVGCSRRTACSGAAKSRLEVAGTLRGRTFRVCAVFGDRIRRVGSGPPGAGFAS